MKKKKLLLATMLTVTVGVVAATLGISGFKSNEKVDLVSADAYKLTLDSSNVPTEVAGITSSSPVNIENSVAVNPNIPMTYTKVYEPTSGHVSIAGGGNVSCSSSASKNIDDINYVKVSYTAGGAYLRYGLTGEIHQIHITSGETYRIAGNWFMVRNDSATVACENVEIEVSYPCTGIEFTRPDNTYFDETFDNVDTYNENVCFDNYFSDSGRWTTYSVSDGAATIDCGGANYDSCVNTYGKFTGAYSISARVKFNSANTARTMFYLGKSTYSTIYTQITADTSKGSTIEINTTGNWIRANGVTLVNVTLTAPTDDFSVFTVSVDASHHIFVYQDCVLKASFTSSAYTTDGYCGFGAGTSGESKFVIDGVRTEAAPGGNFNYESFTNTAGNNFILSNRGAAYAKVANNTIKTYLNNDNLYTAGTYKDVEVEFGFKNTSNGRIELVFGNTSPANTGYGAGSNMGTGLIAVVIMNNFVRYYNNNGTNVDTACSLPTTTEFVNVKITLNGTSLKVVCNNNTIVDVTVTALTTAGSIAITRGHSDAAEIELSKFKVTTLA